MSFVLIASGVSAHCATDLGKQICVCGCMCSYTCMSVDIAGDQAAVVSNVDSFFFFFSLYLFFKLTYLSSHDQEFA